jgi:hypothetical protein
MAALQVSPLHTGAEVMVKVPVPVRAIDCELNPLVHSATWLTRRRVPVKEQVRSLQDWRVSRVTGLARARPARDVRRRVKGCIFGRFFFVCQGGEDRGGTKEIVHLLRPLPQELAGRWLMLR